MPTTKYPFLFILFALVLISCTPETKKNDVLQQVLRSDNPKIKPIIDSADTYEVQILLTTVHRSNDSVYFTDEQFRVNDSNYFYPASTVKLPIAFLALEKLEKDARFDRKTPFYIDGDSVETDFETEINKIFAVSDNEAFNRLFEYLSKDYINKKLRDKGIQPVRISHRLSTDDAYNLKTRAVIFRQNDTTLTQVEGNISSPIETLQINSVKKGKGYVDSNDSIVYEPMDFSQKNYLPVSSLHQIMKRIIFPQAFPTDEQFQLSESDREFILKSMSFVPRNLGYDEAEYYDSYGKFFIYGDSKDRIPDSIKIYNKVGYAYGYLTDCAYIYDTESKKEFIVTATLHVNKNRIYNDGNYEYDNVGIPFLAELGRQLYATIKK